MTFFLNFLQKRNFYIGRYKVFITHGHNYYVSLDTECIREEGAARNADIVMFGHTSPISGVPGWSYSFKPR